MNILLFLVLLCSNSANQFENDSIDPRICETFSLISNLAICEHYILDSTEEYNVGVVMYNGNVKHNDENYLFCFSSDTRNIYIKKKPDLPERELLESGKYPAIPWASQVKIEERVQSILDRISKIHDIPLLPYQLEKWDNYMPCWRVTAYRKDKSGYPHRDDMVGLFYTPMGEVHTIHTFFVSTPPKDLTVKIKKEDAEAIALRLANEPIHDLFPRKKYDLHISDSHLIILKPARIFQPFNFGFVGEDLYKSKLVWQVVIVPSRKGEKYDPNKRLEFRRYYMCLDPVTGEPFGWDMDS